MNEGGGGGGGRRGRLFPHPVHPYVPPNGVMNFPTPDLECGIHILGLFLEWRHQTPTGILTKVFIFFYFYFFHFNVVLYLVLYLLVVCKTEQTFFL